ncbi:MAG: hypothetical protein BWY19_01073 [bacterium ADurb.Bin212]|nr:MAG: hypothetical protein BWY19_01073 [bacterium ADurb.Bin212]
MKIFIIASKYNYKHIPEIAKVLHKSGHPVVYPNSYRDPFSEERIRDLSKSEHIKMKQKFFKDQLKKIASVDAVLVVNENKGEQKNYIGGATFLEIYDAWRMKKKIFLLNPIPEGILKDELTGFDPLVIGKDFSLVN